MASLSVLAGVLFMVDAFQGPASGPPVDHHAVGQSFRDCDDVCPEMVMIPPGKFTIGSPPSERGRGSDEDPQQQVTIAYALAVGEYPVTRGEFAAFVKDTGRRLGSCEHWDGNFFRIEKSIFWNNVPDQTDRHPVVCVDWNDARAYAQWLSRKTGHSYRLLDEGEWEYAARAGTTSAWYWGDSEASQCRYANGADVSAKAKGVIAPGFASCDDHYALTSPVGSFRPNGFGLYDMGGNAGEWVQDCYQNTYHDEPTDGGAVETCLPKFHDARVMRGGGWNAIPAWLRSASRDVEVPSQRSDTFGFRVARMH
jgi:formylglycine-generating enzyme required for sulfatase activity